jgi:hypothetical protein
MNDLQSPPRSLRRHLGDAVTAVLLLAVAIVNGYSILGPWAIQAGPLATTPAPLAAAPAPETARVPGGPVMEAPAPRPQPAPEPAGRARPVWPEVVTGRVIDPERQPLAGASLVLAGREVRADADGRFAIAGRGADDPLLVKVPGFARVRVDPAATPLEVRLSPSVVKAAYLTYYGVADRRIRTRVLNLIDHTELNAVVIDVKGDRGWIPYRTEIPQARAAGTQGPVLMHNFDTMMADLRLRGIYTIARVVVFKDNVLAQHRPDLAVIDTRTGAPWIDHEKLAWVDPFREEVWDYVIAVAREAALRGFDEIQFDYVRFPTDGRLSAARYARPNTRETRVSAIAGFLARARRELGPLGVFVAADIFGYTAFNRNDTDIGQRVEDLAPHVDYLSPMVYPSGYHLGIPGFRNPVEHPYHIVHESVRLIRLRAGSHPVRIRPWLQDFRDYAFDRRIFGPTEVRAQIGGSDDAGGVGWMLWNPRNHYTVAALRPHAAGPLR